MNTSWRRKNQESGRWHTQFLKVVVTFCLLLPTTIYSIESDDNNSQNGTVQNEAFHRCQALMEMSDSDRNFMMDKNEYVAFLNHISNFQYESSTYLELPDSLQDIFNSSAHGGAIKIAGDIPSEATATNTSTSQIIFLQQLCTDTIQQVIALSSTTSLDSLLAQALNNAEPTRTSEVAVADKQKNDNNNLPSSNNIALENTMVRKIISEVVMIGTNRPSNNNEFVSLTQNLESPVTTDSNLCTLYEEYVTMVLEKNQFCSCSDGEITCYVDELCYPSETLGLSPLPEEALTECFHSISVNIALHPEETVTAADATTLVIIGAADDDAGTLITTPPELDSQTRRTRSKFSFGWEPKEYGNFDNGLPTNEEIAELQKLADDFFLTVLEEKIPDHETESVTTIFTTAEYPYVEASGKMQILFNMETYVRFAGVEEPPTFEQVADAFDTLGAQGMATFITDYVWSKADWEGVWYNMGSAKLEAEAYPAESSHGVLTITTCATHATPETIEWEELCSEITTSITSPTHSESTCTISYGKEECSSCNVCEDGVGIQFDCSQQNANAVTTTTKEDLCFDIVGNGVIPAAIMTAVGNMGEEIFKSDTAFAAAAGSNILTIQTAFNVNTVIDSSDTDLLLEAFILYVEQVSVNLEDQQQQQTIGRRRTFMLRQQQRRKLSVTLDETSIELFDMVACPDNETCTTVHGKYNVVLAEGSSDSPAGIFELYTDATNAGIEDGTFSEIIAELDPESQMVVSSGDNESLLSSAKADSILSSLALSSNASSMMITQVDVPMNGTEMQKNGTTLMQHGNIFDVGSEESQQRNSSITANSNNNITTVSSNNETFTVLENRGGNVFYNNATTNSVDNNGTSIPVGSNNTVTNPDGGATSTNEGNRTAVGAYTNETTVYPQHSGNGTVTNGTSPHNTNETAGATVFYGNATNLTNGTLNNNNGTLIGPDGLDGNNTASINGTIPRSNVAVYNNVTTIPNGTSVSAVKNGTELLQNGNSSSTGGNGTTYGNGTSSAYGNGTSPEYGKGTETTVIDNKNNITTPDFNESLNTNNETDLHNNETVVLDDEDDDDEEEEEASVSNTILNETVSIQVQFYATSIREISEIDIENLNEAFRQFVDSVVSESTGRRRQLHYTRRMLRQRQQKQRNLVVDLNKESVLVKLTGPCPASYDTISSFCVAVQGMYDVNVIDEDSTWVQERYTEATQNGIDDGTLASKLVEWDLVILPSLDEAKTATNQPTYQDEDGDTTLAPTTPFTTPPADDNVEDGGFKLYWIIAGLVTGCLLGCCEMFFLNWFCQRRKKVGEDKVMDDDKVMGDDKVMDDDKMTDHDETSIKVEKRGDSETENMEADTAHSKAITVETAGDDEDAGNESSDDESKGSGRKNKKKEDKKEMDNSSESLKMNTKDVASKKKDADPKKTKRFRETVVELLEKHFPERLHEVDDMMEEFKGDETALIMGLKWRAQSMEKKKEEDQHRKEVEELIDLYFPERKHEIDSMLEEFKGEEGALIIGLKWRGKAMLKKKKAEKEAAEKEAAEREAAEKEASDNDTSDDNNDGEESYVLESDDKDHEHSDDDSSHGESSGDESSVDDNEDDHKQQQNGDDEKLEEADKEIVAQSRGSIMSHESVDERHDRHRKAVEELVTKYFPEKKDQIDIMMEQYKGQEAALISALKMQAMSKKMKSQRLIVEDENRHRKQVEILVDKYFPEKKGEIDAMMEEFKGDEAALIFGLKLKAKALVKKQKLEQEAAAAREALALKAANKDKETTSTEGKVNSATWQRNRSYREEVEILVDKHFPEKKGEIDAMMEEFKGNEAGLVMGLKWRAKVVLKKKAAEEKLENTMNNSKGDISKVDKDRESGDERHSRHRKTVEELLTQYFPEKLAHIDIMMHQYKGKEPALISALKMQVMAKKMKSGSESETDRHRKQVEEIVEKHFPEKKDEIDSMMEEFKGKESALIFGLKLKAKALVRKQNAEKEAAAKKVAEVQAGETEQAAKEQPGEEKKEQAKEEEAKEEQAKEEAANELHAKEEQGNDQQEEEHQAAEEQAKEQLSGCRLAGGELAKEDELQDEKAKEESAEDDQAKEESAEDEQAKEESAENEQAKEESAEDQQAEEESAEDEQAKEDLVDAKAKEDLVNAKQGEQETAEEEQVEEEQAKEDPVEGTQAEEQPMEEGQAKEEVVDAEFPGKEQHVGEQADDNESYADENNEEESDGESDVDGNNEEDQDHSDASGHESSDDDSSRGESSDDDSSVDDNEDDQKQQQNGDDEKIEEADKEIVAQSRVSTMSHESVDERQCRHRKAVEELVTKYFPEKKDQIDIMMEHYKGQEAALISALKMQAMSKKMKSQRLIVEDENRHRKQVEILVDKYFPEKKGDIDTMMEEFKGDEAALIFGLKLKAKALMKKQQAAQEAAAKEAATIE